eukprot:s2372_g13.t1
MSSSAAGGDVELWTDEVSLVASSSDLIDLRISCLTGEECSLEISTSALAKEVHLMAAKKLKAKKGAKMILTLNHQTSPSPLLLQKSLEQQGVVGKTATLSCLYVPTCLYAAWRCIQGLPDIPGEVALEGVTQIEGTTIAMFKYLNNLPKSLESLTFGESFNQSLERVILPSTLQSLTFGSCFNQSLERVILPSSLESLTFGSSFNCSLEGVTLPSSLRYLTFGDNFNWSLHCVNLPIRLLSLTFGHDFNQNFEQVTLPSSLQSLTFGNRFNCSLEGVALPSSLRSLTFGLSFNCCMERVSLPSSLRFLTFGFNFNQNLEQVTLPSSIRSLTFGHSFNQTLEGVPLPGNLQSLTFGHDFNRSLEQVTLPCSLQSLTFGEGFNWSPKRVVLPRNLQCLTLSLECKGCMFNRILEKAALPSNLKSLTFGDGFNQSLDRVTLPGNLQSLTFGCSFNWRLDRVTLPSNLQRLTFGNCFNRSLERVNLPSSLESLTFGDHFDQSLEQVTLPSSIRSLTFGHHFNQDLARVMLPSSLENLAFGHCFNQRLAPVTLPSSLQTLTFGYNFNRSLQQVTLPNSLLTLTFGHQFNQSLERVTLPSNLQSLTFGPFFSQNLGEVRFPQSLQSLTCGYGFKVAGFVLLVLGQTIYGEMLKIPGLYYPPKDEVESVMASPGADPNTAADSGAFGVGFTQVGAYPLHLAAKRGRRRVMEVLLRAGAAVDAADQNGRTALMVAAASGQCGASAWLLEHRAEVDWRTHYGYTALHHAALVPRPEVVEILLEGRASTEVMDREGRTALHATLSTLPSGSDGRSRRAAVASTSCDPAGIGDEYCYDHDISHGYRRMEQEEFQLRAVKTALMALLRSRADVHVRDGFGRSALDIMKDKRRGDLASWLQSLGDEGHCSVKHRNWAAATWPLSWLAHCCCSSVTANISTWKTELWGCGSGSLLKLDFMVKSHGSPDWCRGLPVPRGTAWSRHGAAPRLALMVGQRKEGDASAAPVDGPPSPGLSPHLNVPPLPSESEASSEASGEVKRRRLTVVRGQIPGELEELLTKPFSEEEREQIFESVGLTTVPQQLGKAPIALWLFGPPAAGKTSVSEEVEEEYFGAKGSAVSIDGSHVRDSHTGFQKVLKHGFDHQMIHADAWSKLKATKYVERLKEEIFLRAVKNRISAASRFCQVGCRKMP